ncbi:MAG: anaerobic ribonucleoside-triphosphate reductase activating protein [Paludibacteraceae bacterium]|nr:anaerobic ribonucleoside-triphosphate reductase activating protein [Paludibacteraceae bacterium]
MALRVINIAEGTSVDGPGLRTSIYFAGCKHACPGCHNPESWPFDAGSDWTVERLLSLVKYNRFDVTFSGGDPMYQAAELLPLAKAIREAGYGIWCYTGFRFEDIRDKSPYKELLEYIDVLVDGPFVEKEKPAGKALRFRGSKNQRFIVPKTGEELEF